MDTTVAADTTGNWDGVYHDSSFFASGEATSVTGHDGVPNSAVKFNKDAGMQILTPTDPNDLTENGGILARDPDGFMVDLWFREHQNPDGNLYGESLNPNGGAPGSSGPTIGFLFNHPTPGLQFFITSVGFGLASDMAHIDPPDGG